MSWAGGQLSLPSPPAAAKGGARDMDGTLSSGLPPAPACPSRPDRNDTSDGRRHRHALGLCLQQIETPELEQKHFPAPFPPPTETPKFRSTSTRAPGKKTVPEQGKTELGRKAEVRWCFAQVPRDFRPKLAQSGPTSAWDVGRILALGTCPDRDPMLASLAFCWFLAVTSAMSHG